MDQQENMVGLHSFKLNYLNSSKEKLINFNSVCCNFYKNVRIITKNNFKEKQSSTGLFIDHILVGE